EPAGHRQPSVLPGGSLSRFRPTWDELSNRSRSVCLTSSSTARGRGLRRDAFLVEDSSSCALRSCCTDGAFASSKCESCGPAHLIASKISVVMQQHEGATR